MPTLKDRYDTVRREFEMADTGFFVLRIIALSGTVAFYHGYPTGIAVAAVSTVVCLLDCHKCAFYEIVNPSCTRDPQGNH